MKIEKSGENEEPEEMRVIPSRSTDPETSHKGERDVKMRANSQKVKLLQAYSFYGEMNSERAAKVAGISMRACFWKRCSELHRDMGFLEPTGKEENGDSGSARRVYRITDRGMAYLGRNHA